MLEATAPHPSRAPHRAQLGGYLPGDRRRLPARRATRVQPHGTRLFVQLFHGGREQIASPPRAARPRAVGDPEPALPHRAARAAGRTRSRRSSRASARSAALAAEGGLDGIEISAAHRYLVEQFFDPELNRRDDEWAEPRRFLLAVVRAVRDGGARPLPRRAPLGRLASRPESPMAPLCASEVDYLARARRVADVPRLGAIVPPPPADRRARSRAHAEPFRVGAPLIATSRVVDPTTRTRLVAAGAADASA